MSELIDLTGKRFGRWIVLKRTSNGKDRHARWFCKCECGRERIIGDFQLRNGISRQCHSCGNTKHGLSRTRIYGVWDGMIQRCENPNHMSYKDYGGRGIKICKEWRRDPATFCKWALANGYKEGLTIDRIDNDGDYRPDNCQFITMAKQNRNRRANRLIKVGGEVKSIIEWAEQAEINYQTLRSRLNAGWPEYKLLESARAKERCEFYGLA